MDFNVSRGSTTIAAGELTRTLTAGVDYALEPGVDEARAWLRIVSTHATGGGPTSGGGIVDTRDTFVCPANPANLASSITLRRYGTDGDTRVEWELVQYVGDSAGPNAVVVRQQQELDLSNFQTVAHGVTLYMIDDPARVAVLVLGQRADEPLAQYPQAGLFTTALVAEGPDWRAQATRGYPGPAGSLAQVAVAVLEFTGAAWRDPQRVEFTSAAHGASAWTAAVPATSGTYPLPAALLDLSKAFLLQVQFRNSTAGVTGNDERGDVVELLGTTQLRTRRSSADDDANRTLVAWVLENTQAGLGAMEVRRLSSYRAGSAGPEELVTPLAVAEVLEDRSSVVGLSSSSDGTGAGLPRGVVSARLSSSTSVELVEAEVAQPRWVGLEVVQWPDANPDRELELDPVLVTLTAPDPSLGLVADTELAPVVVELVVPDAFLPGGGELAPVVVQLVVPLPRLILGPLAILEAQVGLARLVQHASPLLRTLQAEFPVVDLVQHAAPLLAELALEAPVVEVVSSTVELG